MDRPIEGILAEWIGAMTIRWNRCQSIIFMMFRRATGDNILLAKAMFFALRSDGTQRDITAAALQIALVYHPDLMARAVTAISDFSKIAGRRNDFIHAMWYFPDDAKPPEVWLNVRKNLHGKDPFEEAKKLIADLDAIFSRLHNLRAEIEQALQLPKNALASVGRLAPPPPPQGEQMASSDQAPPKDEPAAPPSPPPASEE
jgi:hypothetical protein